MTSPIPFPSDRVVDVVIVGAGVCGLALARQLNARGLQVQVIEARERLGGRVLTQLCPATGQALDLGPRWFWPDTEPRITTLLTELGLASTPQHDPGDALWLTDPNREPERRSEPGGVHAGARCIEGGSARLIDALAAQLPAGCIRTGVAVQALRDKGAWIELSLSTGRPLRARQVVLALPPRLVHEKIEFAPPLPAAIDAALAQTATWMAAQARSVTTFAQPFWREAGQSGNAFVRHAQAVLAEVFDSSQADEGGALGGFVALNVEQRESFQRGLPLLIDSQLAQLFGAKAQDGHMSLQDWANEPWTCSAIDRASPPELPVNQPLLRQPLWTGRIFLGGTETAAHGAGHMEGALEAADRIAHAICRPRSAAASVPAPDDAPDSRQTALGQFAAAVLALRGTAPERYRQHLTQLLSNQQTELLTQRALLATADQVYSESLARLDGLLPALDVTHAEVVNGRHALSPALLAAFDGWNKGLLDAALSFNSSSCALSNFAQDHHPDADTLRAITLDLAAAWREFALELNTRLLSASGHAELV
ncbi:FAD-dependent oxidoreductase [Rhodoferax sp.]|uniref:flavin monoamine oxidase family protein n=1 Tax=Rhodoferax sp. TaxID=50421 RepID=UPI00284AD050|nr:FAD-dependent oxidoreductase [Rhodoferax sp.]MDR3369499.1 FAD-dependent oxidoreductase [Rhodoferax sp.]